LIGRSHVFPDVENFIEFDFVEVDFIAPDLLSEASNEKKPPPDFRRGFFG
jgi:hypothetical protein